MNWEILTKYIVNETTPGQNAEVEKWLEEKPANKLLLKQLQEKHEQLNQPLKDEAVHNEWTKLLDRILETPKPETINKSVRMFWGLGIAATLLLASLLTWLSLRSSVGINQEYTVLKTSAHQRREFKLPDGSVAYLGPKSILKVSGQYGQGTRKVSLTGEAFFDVQHHAHVPFTVTTANNAVVHVLGTSFNVLTQKEKNEEIKVATGLVGVVVNGKTHYIKAGNELSYQVAGQKLHIQRVDVREASALQNGTLYFHDSPVDEIALKIQRYYNVEVEVLPSAYQHARFSGEMKDTGISNLLDGLAYATGIQYRFKNENKIILY
ncbi:FecR family protein [Mucilaginibacter lacusdianchii]|uniref:FecR family protein n=1 Tax=Mucilaginibacter lacusdianchii TaxID=2684211 RepID=UPI00131B0362|nr:FecR domain-containing protein [Mucilaginibacter sp. JXJ CY 39]